MMDAWHVVTASVRGASHKRNDRPNQDAVASHSGEELTVVVVADGHGEARCFRSARGAQIAVETTIEVLRRQLGDAMGGRDPRHLQAYLPRAITRAWRDKVTAHYAAAPFGDHVKSLLPPSDWITAYGSTLLAVAATPEGLLLLQLGDGDILLVDGDNQVLRLVPPEPRQLGNATLSLCDERAEREFRAIWRPAELQTRLILLATDGYGNSFSDDGGFRQTAVDYMTLLDEHGPELIAAHIEEWLEETSEQGSGDDITVGLLWRRSVGPAVLEMSGKPDPDDTHTDESRSFQRSCWSHYP